MKQDNLKPKNGLFCDTEDFINLSEIVRDYPFVNEVSITSENHFKELLKELQLEKTTVPLFLKDNNGVIHLIPSLPDSFLIEKGNELVYLGKTIV
jgi:hypothetical protein